MITPTHINPNATYLTIIFVNPINYTIDRMRIQSIIDLTSSQQNMLTELMKEKKKQLKTSFGICIKIYNLYRICVKNNNNNDSNQMKRINDWYSHWSLFLDSWNKKNDNYNNKAFAL